MVVRKIDKTIRKVILPAALVFSVLGGLWKWLVDHDPQTGIIGVAVAFGVVGILEIIYRKSGDFRPR